MSQNIKLEGSNMFSAYKLQFYICVTISKSKSFKNGKRGCKISPQIKAVSFRNEAHRLFMHIFAVVDNLLSKIERTNYTFSKSSF